MSTDAKPASIFYEKNGLSSQATSINELSALALAGELSHTTSVWHDGLDGWTTLEQAFPSIASLCGGLPSSAGPAANDGGSPLAIEAELAPMPSAPSLADNLSLPVEEEAKDESEVEKYHVLQNVKFKNAVSSILEKHRRAAETQAKRHRQTVSFHRGTHSYTGRHSFDENHPWLDGLGTFLVVATVIFCYVYFTLQPASGAYGTGVQIPVQYTLFLPLMLFFQLCLPMMFNRAEQRFNPWYEKVVRSADKVQTSLNSRRQSGRRASAAQRMAERSMPSRMSRMGYLSRLHDYYFKKASKASAATVVVQLFFCCFVVMSYIYGTLESVAVLYANASFIGMLDIYRPRPS
jgi:hypothetical protein